MENSLGGANRTFAATMIAAAAVIPFLLAGCPMPVETSLRNDVETAVEEARPPVATPAFLPSAGTFSADQNVTITCATAGATIHFTTDGKPPTETSPIYRVPVVVAGHGTSVTIMALATAPGMRDSKVAGAMITIDYDQVSTPQFLPGSGTYSAPQTVTISCPTDGVRIRYSLDDSIPSETSGIEIDPGNTVAVAATAVLRAVACKEGLAPSTVASAAYTIAPPRIAVFSSGSEIAIGGLTEAFEPAVEGIPYTASFTIRNTGSGLLTLRETNPVVITGTDAALFSLATPPSALVLGAGAGSEFTVTLSLPSAGLRSARIDIYSDDTERNPCTFRIEKTALPAIGVFSGDSAITGPDGAYTFPDVEFGQYVDAVLTVRNIGKANLTLTGGAPVSVTGQGLSLLSQPPSQLAPGVSADWSLRFRPEAPGTGGGTVSIASDAAGGKPYTFKIEGRALLMVKETPIVAGERSVFVVKSDGSAWGWGDNSYSGGFGDGTDQDRYSPVSVPGLSGVASLEVETFHTFALAKDGRAWAWGYDVGNELGNGSSDDSRVPVPVTVIADVAALEAGEICSIALKRDGSVWAWGSNRALGIGLTTSESENATRVPGLSGIVAIAAGANFALALGSDGSVEAWGSNRYGQLGDGSWLDHASPAPVSGLSDVAAIAAGQDYAMALKRDGTVYAWGYNGYAQLGDGTTTNRTLPVQVPGLAGISSIAAGFDHSLALDGEGRIWGWGSNLYHQLANEEASFTATTPVEAQDLPTIAAIAVGEHHSAAVATDGSVWTWGNNWSGQLGDGGTAHRELPAQVPVFAGVAAIETGVGSGYALAVKKDGSLWAWGNNGDGQLGVGSYSVRSSTPLQVLGSGGVGTLSGIAAASAGSLHSLALGADSRVWSWGDNSWGQLGDGSPAGGRSHPEPIAGLSGVVAISAGSFHSLALLDDGSVWAWGNNEDGQLGDGTTTDRATPVKVPELAGIVAISAGEYYSVVVKDDGTVWAWGYNYDGQLGDGTETDRLSPVQVVGLLGVTQAEAGTEHTVALKGDGTVWAWGDNWYGQLGDGTLTDRAAPVQVASLSGITAVAAGDSFTEVLKSDNTVWGFGTNIHGQLGDGSTTGRRIPVKAAGLPEVSAIDTGPYSTLALTGSGLVWGWGWNGSGGLGDADLNDHLSPALAGGLFRLW